MTVSGIDPRTRPLRWLRAVSVSSLTVGLSVAGHVVGGGSVPHPLAVLVIAGLASAPAYLLGRRRLTFVRLAGLLATGQLLIHWVLSEPTDAAHHMHGAAATAPGGLPMLGGHALATLAAGVLLAYGETLLWLVWELLRPLLALPQRVVIATADVRLPIVDAGPRPRRIGVRGAESPRGPPAVIGVSPTAW
ncbi:hypothetical protein [Kribbella sp. CA-247076]|uniref:hypothetical protein n=1 Tax=Kribbella sp. CA-247076 TaxID=3239941 RepID=UPI003D8A57F9